MKYSLWKWQRTFDKKMELFYNIQVTQINFLTRRTTLNIAVIDDVRTDLLKIKKDLLSIYQTKNIEIHIQLFDSAEHFFQVYKPGNFHLIILDIYMNGMNGMDAARKIREDDNDCDLIFITDSDTHAIESYDVHAAYYILKPYDVSKLSEILTMLQTRKAQQSRYIEVISDRVPLRIPVRSILYADTYKNAVQLHTDAGLIRSYITFHELEERLKELDCFLSCCRGCLVNMDRILKTTEDGFLLDNMEAVFIRKRGSNQIKKAYLEYLFSSSANT